MKCVVCDFSNCDFVQNYPPFPHRQDEIQRKMRHLPKTEATGIAVSSNRGIGSILSLGMPFRLIAFDFEAETEVPPDHNEENENEILSCPQIPDDKEPPIVNSSNETS